MPRLAVEPPEETGLKRFLPPSLHALPDPQKDIPRIAKDKALMAQIEDALPHIPTTHHLHLGDARAIELPPESVHLVLTSPPYWTLKEYNRTEGQLGHVVDYEEFLCAMDKVWRRCFEALVPGGRLICVVGDVCLSRRQNGGRHTVVPLHAATQERCRAIGFDNLAPIVWHKIANARMEAEGNGSAFLGKPYEPNSVIKNDIEFILMQRKPGGYRTPDLPTRILSIISGENYQLWFQQIWTGLTGASTRNHPAPFPLELATRLVRMFSFVGDVVLDPFMGTGTTTLAAAQCGRNSIGFEIDADYFARARAPYRQDIGIVRRGNDPLAPGRPAPVSDILKDLDQRLRQAIASFWSLRGSQADRQGGDEGDKDRGGRSAVAGGKHLDGFRELVAALLEAAGLQRAMIYWRKMTELPGWFRAEKNWDLLVVADGKLIAIIEFKSQVGSFGNNFNNRTEEALGNATDLWAAYEKGAFKPSERPWLGYLMMLEDAPRSNSPVKVKEPHFPVFQEFKGASYAERYNQLMTRLVRAKLYDAACFLMWSREGGLKGEYREMNPELSFHTFVTSLLARAIAAALTQPHGPSAPPQVVSGDPPPGTPPEVD